MWKCLDGAVTISNNWSERGFYFDPLGFHFDLLDSHFGALICKLSDYPQKEQAIKHDISRLFKIIKNGTIFACAITVIPEDKVKLSTILVFFGKW